MADIKRERAELRIAIAIDKAQRQSLNPMTVAILDACSNLGAAMSIQHESGATIGGCGVDGGAPDNGKSMMIAGSRVYSAVREGCREV